MNKYRIVDHNWLIHKINNRIIEIHHDNLRGRVVDLGCGTSPYKEDIRRWADQYIGVDWRHSMHAQSNVDVFLNLMDTFPFRDRCADTVVSFQVMEHLPDPKHFLSEAFRILKPGGCMLLTVPFMWQVHEAPHDYYRFTRYGLEYLFKCAGFTNCRVSENTGFWQMWVLKFNYYTVFFARRLAVAKFILIPFWLFGQLCAPLLDRIDPRDVEAASYTVVARRPL